MMSVFQRRVILDAVKRLSISRLPLRPLLQNDIWCSECESIITGTANMAHPLMLRLQTINIAIMHGWYADNEGPLCPQCNRPRMHLVKIPIRSDHHGAN
jgi:hypothetical protein